MGMQSIGKYRIARTTLNGYSSINIQNIIEIVSSMPGITQDRILQDQMKGFTEQTILNQWVAKAYKLGLVTKVKSGVYIKLYPQLERIQEFEYLIDRLNLLHTNTI